MDVTAVESIVWEKTENDERLQIDIGNYLIDYSRPLHESVLFITFENRNSNRDDPNRLPWGYKFLIRAGHAILGIKAKNADWYRNPDIHEFFSSQALDALISSHKKVIYYGSSMGGYGALTFATPGSIVLAHNPQTTLDERLVPWELRFPEGRSQDWSGAFSDATEGATRASRVFVTYDPYFQPDRKHVDRLDGANLIRLPVPFVGHSMPDHLLRMRVLKPLVDRVVNATLTEQLWHQMARSRRQSPNYYLGLARRARSPGLCAALLDRVCQLDTTMGPAFQAAMRLSRQRGIADRLSATASE